MIPLIENKPSMLRAHEIVEEYMRDKPLDYQRVFLARSDPAMTYGSTSAVLLLKIALHRLHLLEKKIGIPVYPIVGLGSVPFRGNFKPTHIKSRLKGYPSVQTFTVQSAFKFDYPEELVRSAIRDLKNAGRGEPIPVQDEETLLEVIEKISATFARQVKSLAPLINKVSQFVPSRRKRRLHTGLFGYARSVSGIRLPRAISFCASLYSIGVPPELLGLANLNRQDLALVIKHYPNFYEDMNDALQFMDTESFGKLPVSIRLDLKKTLRLLKDRPDPNLIHQALVRAIRKSINRGDPEAISDLVVQAARERKFLG
jgi:phosphoenolpyruvate carboxylase